MNTTNINSNGDQHSEKKYKGVRRRKWGKWVSEIRIPGSQHRLWLGTYSSPEAAAVAHDVAYYCLHRPLTLQRLNFPKMVPVERLSGEMSPRSVQRAASDAGMGVDALAIGGVSSEKVEEDSGDAVEVWEESEGWSCGAGAGEVGELSVSVDDYMY